MDLKSFYNKVLAIEVMSLSHVLYQGLLKNILLEELYVAAYKLKGHIVMDILPEVVSKVVHIVEIAQNVGFRDDWIDRVSGEIHKEREHWELIQNAQTS